MQNEAAIITATPARTGSFGRLLWPVTIAAALVVIGLRNQLSWLETFPAEWTVALDAAINVGMTAFVSAFKSVFRGLAWLLEWPLLGIQTALLWMPWVGTMALSAILAHAAGGRRLAVFTIAAFTYMLMIGYWTESMNTLALVLVAAPMSIGLGFLMGVLGHLSARARCVIDPMLDLMQTIPAFAYLIPILLLFGFGPVVGLIASVIFAVPPMVRNTILGLQRVPEAIQESAEMSGCSPWQRFFWATLPTARSQLMVGVNQTTMAVLSMVIIAAIIGGSGDIGWEVLSTMRKAQFGQSLLAGLVIALIAMVMDRIGHGFAIRRSARRPIGDNAGAVTLMYGHPHLALAIGAFVASLLAAAVFPALGAYPDNLVYYPAEPLNEFVEWILVTFGSSIDTAKNAIMFFGLIPLRIGLEHAVLPMTWGFELTPGICAGFAIAVATVATVLTHRSGIGPGAAVVVAGIVSYFGISGIPWPAFFIILTAIAWSAGGARVTIFAVSAAGFILLSGSWEPMTRSLYLCLAAVTFSFLIGGGLGIWAAHDDRVSAFLRPINDTLQTMPQFVLLIPVLMLFQVGEFSALIAIIMYAVVPPIRYVEHGLRNVSPAVVEAARQIGCSPLQLFFQVKLPLALPVIMLGLNQTIMYALAMLVIAALVGTRGLGQQVYTSLGQADVGNGLVAGLSIALVAMTADRIIKAWSEKRMKTVGGRAPD